MSSNLHNGHVDDRGFWSRTIFSTDHKVIAKQYLTVALFWALMGGATAYLAGC